jgi:hypothetical protein
LPAIHGQVRRADASGEDGFRSEHLKDSPRSNSKESERILAQKLRRRVLAARGSRLARCERDLGNF